MFWPVRGGGLGNPTEKGEVRGEGVGDSLSKINSLPQLDVYSILTNELPENNLYNDVTLTSLFHDSSSLIKNFKNSGKPIFLNINIQSLNSKFEKLSNFILSLTNSGVVIDLIAMQETWKIRDPSLLSIPGFQPLVYKCRSKGRGGGVGFYIRNGINYKIIENLSPFKDKIFESLTLEITQQHNNTTKHYLACSIYRSPSSITGLTPSQQIDEFYQKFDNLLHDTSNKNFDSYIFMDSNINLLNLTTDQSVKNFLQTFTERGYLITNLKATRMQGGSHSLIDNILTNGKADSYVSGSIIDDISDHFMTFLQPSLSRAKSKPRTVRSRKMDTESINNLKNALDNLSWQNLSRTTSVDDCYNSFWCDFEGLFDLYLPITEKKFNKNMHKISEFMSTGLLKSRKTKLNLHKLSILTPSPENITKYKTYRNLFNSLVRASKKLHYSNKLKDNAKNPKKLWDTLKEITVGGKNLNEITKIEKEGKIISDKMGMAEEFNRFFTEVGQKIADSVDPVQRLPDDFESPECPKLVFSTVTQSELVTIIDNMEAKTSTDYHGLSMKLIKDLKYQLALPLTHLFNLSITTGTFPSHLKTSRTIPIFKSGNPLLCDNYRPISLLSSLSKILEKIISIKLVNHLEINHLLHNHQYGFQRNKSTVHHLLHLTNYISGELNKKKYCLGIFLDLKKAFDVVNHEILLKKLAKLGITGTALQWFASYLNGRKQCVDIGGKISSSRNLDISVLQGSILGPILFLCFINDLNLSTTLLALLFADDTIALASDTDLPRLIDHVNAEMQKLANWFRCNQMAVNVSKTKYMIFRPRGVQIDLQGKEIIFNNNEIGQPNTPERIFKLERCYNDNPNKDHITYKLLGVLFDEFLSFDQHVQKTCSKISQSNYIISRAKNFLNPQSLKMLYFSMIHPHFLYCLPVYGCTSTKNINKLKKIQRKAVRTITKSSYNAPTVDLFKSLEILPIELLIQNSQGLLVHSIFHKYCPPALYNAWTLNNQREDDHNLRNANDFYIPLARTEQVKKLTLFTLPKTWNDLPEFKLTSNKTTFKIALKNHLLSMITE